MGAQTNGPADFGQVKFTCPCGKRILAPRPGVSVRCPKCGKVLTAPGGQSERKVVPTTRGSRPGTILPGREADRAGKMVAVWGGVAVTVVVLVLVCMVAMDIKKREREEHHQQEQEAIEEQHRQEQDAIAETIAKLKAEGDGFVKAGEFARAKATYEQALDTVKHLDSKDHGLKPRILAALKSDDVRFGADTRYTKFEGRWLTKVEAKAIVAEWKALMSCVGELTALLRRYIEERQGSSGPYAELLAQTITLCRQRNYAEARKGGEEVLRAAEGKAARHARFKQAWQECKADYAKALAAVQGRAQAHQGFTEGQRKSVASLDEMVKEIDQGERQDKVRRDELEKLLASDDVKYGLDPNYELSDGKWVRKSREYRLRLAIEKVASRRIRITVTTNFPDGTNLHLTATRTYYEKGNAAAYGGDFFARNTSAECNSYCGMGGSWPVRT